MAPALWTAQGPGTQAPGVASPRANTPTPNPRNKPALPRTKSQGCAAGLEVKPLRVNLPRQTISIRTLTELYSGYFPCRVIVDKQLGPLLLPHDMLDVHFVKKRPTMRVASRNLQYILPLKAAVKAGFLHQGYNSDQTVFETVADLIAASPMPKVVCSRKGWGAGAVCGAGAGTLAPDQPSGIAAGEVIALLDVTYQGEQRMLRVYSYALKSAKLLPTNCAGSFTLCPSEIKLSLSELHDNAGISFPWSVILFPDISAPSRYPRELFEEVVFVTGCAETASIVCTRYTSDGSGIDVIELSVETPLEVKCVCLSEAHQQALRDHSSKVAERYSEASVTYLCGEWVESANIKGGFAMERGGFQSGAALDHLLCEECLLATSRDKGGPLSRKVSSRNKHEKTSVQATDVPSLLQRYDAILKDVTSVR